MVMMTLMTVIIIIIIICSTWYILVARFVVETSPKCVYLILPLDNMLHPVSAKLPGVYTSFTCFKAGNLSTIVMTMSINDDNNDDDV